MANPIMSTLLRALTSAVTVKGGGGIISEYLFPLGIIFSVTDAPRVPRLRYCEAHADLEGFIKASHEPSTTTTCRYWLTSFRLCYPFQIRVMTTYYENFVPDLLKRQLNRSPTTESRKKPHQGLTRVLRKLQKRLRSRLEKISPSFRILDFAQLTET